MNSSVIYALLAAALFGASTPVAKWIGGDIPPLLMGGLLYLGSGVGLSVFRLLRDRGVKPSGLAAGEWRWFLAAIVFGGVLAPVALMAGLSRTSASTASLLLNLEAVFTALLAWAVFKENAGQRIVFGMIAIVAGGLVLAWPTDSAAVCGGSGPLLIAVACLAWAIDNNLTRKVAAGDALFIAGTKGLIAGGVNCLLAIGLGADLPPAEMLAATLTVGLFGYGISLVMFVLALRGLGTARTGAYFSTAPFIGAALALLLFDEIGSASLWLAASLMGLGVWLHLTEQHEHPHTHEILEHSHRHVHDAHHQHRHEDPGAEGGAHEHRHRHASITHSHGHYPDIHHRHEH